MSNCGSATTTESLDSDSEEQHGQEEENLSCEDELANPERARSISPEEASATLFKMHEFNQQFAPALKTRQLQLVAESLSQLRAKGTTDVIIVSGDREFPCHRFFLAASCTYFADLLLGGPEGALPGRVTCDLDSKTLEIIMNFIYEGEAPDLITEEELKDVLAASHDMKLNALTEYCAQALVGLLSLDNLFEMWNVAESSELPEMVGEILDYVVRNLNCFLASSEFLCIKKHQVKELLLYAKTKIWSLDNLLLALLQWVNHVLVARERMATDLFACIEPQRISQSCIQTLLENDDLMKSSPTLATNLKDIAMSIFKSINSPHEGLVCDEMCTQFEGLKITFFNEHCLEEFLDPSTKRSVLREVPKNCAQQFDLQTMSWLPLNKLCFSGFKGAAMCQYNQYICIVGGSLGPVYVMYDVGKNIADYISCSVNFHGLMNAGLCVCVNNLFVIGGLVSTGPTGSVHHTVPGNPNWHSLKSLQHARASPTVLASSSVIYVVGGTNGVSDRLIEYYDFGIETPTFWTDITFPNIPREVQIHFFLHMDVLHAIYTDKCDFIHMTCFREESKWQAERTGINVEEMTDISSILTFPNCTKSFICISSNKDNFGIPNYLWEPETGLWSKLTDPKGKCEIPDCYSLQKVCSLKLSQSNLAQGPDDGKLYEWNQNQWRPLASIEEKMSQID